MAEYSVSDILGVGFKFEQYAEEQAVVTPTGTRCAILGTAPWGPIGVPTYISGGLREFKNVFGSAGTKADEGWEAAMSHFSNSAVGYFTRIASSSDKPKRSFKEVKSNSTVAFLTGSTSLPQYVRLYPLASQNANSSFSFTLRHQTDTMANFEDLNYSIDFEALNIASQPAEIVAPFISSGTYQNGQEVSFKVYGEDGNSVGTFSFIASGNKPVSGAQAYVDTLLASQSILDGQGVHFNLSAVNNSIKLTTAPFYYGNNARIEIITDTLGYLTGSDAGVDPLRSSIVGVINSAFLAKQSPANSNNTLGILYGPSKTIASLNSNNNLILTAPTAGETSRLVIGGGSANDILGFQSGNISTGTNAKTVGTFRAKKRGAEGDQVRVVVSNSQTAQPTIKFYFKGTMLGSAVAYNFNPTSPDYLPSIINDSSAISAILSYDHGKTFLVFDEDDATMDTGEPVSGIGISDIIGDGEYVFDGGTNGETISVINDVVPYIEPYGNEDIYEFDYIAVPGYSEQIVHNAMLDICSLRQDIYALLCLPDFGTTPAAIDRVIKWTNGAYTGRTEKLNSQFASLYYPYIKIRKTYYENGEIASSLGDYTPITRVTGAIARGDSLAGNRFSAIAGEKRGGLANVEGLRQTLTAAQRDQLYADAFDACINPIMFNLSAGFFINGQKSALRKNQNGRLTSLSRMNVVKSGLYLKRQISIINRKFFHEPIDAKLQKDYADSIKLTMETLVAQRAIQSDYIIKCDQIINSDEIVNNNGMVAVIEYTPVKTLERIKVISNLKERKTTITV